MRHLLFQSVFAACICTLLATGGCSRKPESRGDAPQKPAQTSVDQILGKHADDPGAPPPAPAPPTEPQIVQNAQPDPQATPVAVTSSGVAGDTSSIGQVPPEAFVKLNVALVVFRGKYQRFPRDWNELISSKCLDKMPQAPAGKRYTFDASGNVLMR